MSNTNVTGTQNDQSLSSIDAALAASAKRQAAKKGTAATPAAGEAAPAPAKRVIKTPEQRLEEAKQREIDRAKRKEERQAKREEAKANKPAPAPAHMKKVAKAAERLPGLSADAQAFFEEAKASLPTGDLIALAAHVQLHCRASATAESSTRKLTKGQTVKIVSTDVAAYAKFIGMVGTVDKAQRIRCYITVPGFEKPVYLHCSDVEDFSPSVEEAPVEEASPESGLEALAEQASEEAAA